jgi:hypothetical protein
MPLKRIVLVCALMALAFGYWLVERAGSADLVASNLTPGSELNAEPGAAASGRRADVASALNARPASVAGSNADPLQQALAAPDAVSARNLVLPLAQRGDAEANEVLANLHSVCAVRQGFTGAQWIREQLQRYCHGFVAWAPTIENAERDAVIAQSSSEKALRRLDGIQQDAGVPAAREAALAIIADDPSPAAVRAALDWAAERRIALFPTGPGAMVGPDHAAQVNAAVAVQLYCELSRACQPGMPYSLTVCIATDSCAVPRGAVETMRQYYPPLLWEEAQRITAALVAARASPRPPGG